MAFFHSVKVLQKILSTFQMANPAENIKNPVWYILPILFFTTGGTFAVMSEWMRYKVRRVEEIMRAAKVT